MGNIIFPSDEWDKPKRRPYGKIHETYLGYGYFFIEYRDGTKELVFDPNMTSIPLGKFARFTDKGFPIYDHYGGDEE